MTANWLILKLVLQKKIIPQILQIYLKSFKMGAADFLDLLIPILIFLNLYSHQSIRLIVD
jgi:hypothetical protein